MIFRNIDADHDWEFGRGVQDYLILNKAVGLNVKTRLLSWVGDCFFDQPAGIDWVNRLGSRNQRALLELDLKRVILQSDGVRSIEEFSTSLISRNFSASYTIKTVYDETVTDSFIVEI